MTKLGQTQVSKLIQQQRQRCRQSQYSSLETAHLFVYMQTSCRQASHKHASTSGRGSYDAAIISVHAPQPGPRRGSTSNKHYSPAKYPCSHVLSRISPKFHATARHIRRQRLVSLCCQQQTNGASDSSDKGLVIVIDNYDSFTYNICQVTTLPGVALYARQQALTQQTGCSIWEI